jgi:DNA-directed RNA polymerase specialized sigma24 family protein
MEQREAQPQIDAVLMPFVQASDEAASQQLLTQLIVDHAEPIIRNIVKHKLRVPAGFGSESRSGEDAEDMRSEVLVQLLSRLSELRANPGEKHINNFQGYVAAITYSAWHEHLRRKHPQRHMLKNKLRYLLSHRESFAVWESDDRELLCGLAGWENQRLTLEATRRIKDLAAGPEACERAGLSAHDIQRWDLASLVAAVFRYLGSSVDLDDLVNLIAQWTGVGDQVSQGTGDDEIEDPFEHVADPRELIDTELQRRTYLRRLWAEIRELRPQQRVALLLNLRDDDGGDVISVFPVAGIATITELADALSMSTERLATLWNELPLDDIAIATHLSITRQQVINLRKSARERLERRMRTF